MEMITQTLNGTVENITYRNEENGYSVIEISCADGIMTAVGTMPLVCIGEEVALNGEYTVHPVYGTQFKVASYTSTLPADGKAILHYLSSGAIKGIGPATAAQIVTKFGEEALDVLENHPEKLSVIRGISAEKAERMGAEFREQTGVREVMLRLARMHLSANEAMRIYKKLGKTSVDKILENPYMLCSESIGIGFLRADEIALGLDYPVSRSYRINAGIEYVLKHNLRNGHTCLPKQKLCEKAASMLGNDIDDTRSHLDELIHNGVLTEAIFDGAEFVFLKYMYKAERYCANRIGLMMTVPPPEIAVHKARLEQFEEENGILYDEIQRQAISNALSKGILILTGGPGTGKTTTLNAIISLLEESGCDIALAAPTGRAAKRMSELCSKEAKTIHRLLEVEWGDDDRQSFARNEHNPLIQDVVVVDELSMMDIQLFEALLRAMSAGCRLIMVGDTDQLPSVGAGNVLHDLIEAGVIPTVRLTRVFRQAQQSLIVTNAHRIIAGELPIVGGKDSDFYMMRKTDGDSCAELVADLYCRRLPEAYGFKPSVNIQVLCPSKMRSTGTVNINNILQEQLNPKKRGKHEIRSNGYTLREGDKVMQVRNNYDIPWITDMAKEGTGVFNGDIGTLCVVDNSSGTVKVRYGDKIASYVGEEMKDLELAYAVTVHKSQGSEFDCVILPMCETPPKLRYRNLLYTAVTRAKALLIIVGADNEVREMVSNDKKTKRYTAFSKFLGEISKNNKAAEHFDDE